MVRVPGIREYAPITDGVKWTEDLSKSTMIDFINNTEPSLNKKLIDWIQKNHEGFTGYDDAEFDEINKAAYLELLKENIESNVFKPLLNKTIYSGRGEEELKILMEVQEGEKQFTLNDIVEGTAQNYALDVEDTESNKALFGELLINNAMDPNPTSEKAVLVFNRLQDRGETTNLGDKEETLNLIHAWINKKAVTDGIKESLINSLKMFKEEVVPYIYNPRGANTSLEDYLRSFLKGQLLLPENRKRSDRGMSVEEYLQAIYDMEPKERISLLNYNSKKFVDSMLSKLSANGLEFKYIDGVTKKLQGISIDDSNLIGEVYKEIETLFNLNTVTPAIGNGYTLRR